RCSGVRRKRTTAPRKEDRICLRTADASQCPALRQIGGTRTSPREHVPERHAYDYLHWKLRHVPRSGQLGFRLRASGLKGERARGRKGSRADEKSDGPSTLVVVLDPKPEA